MANCSWTVLSTTSSHQVLSIASGEAGSPSGHGYGSVSRIIVSPAITTADTTTNARSTVRNGRRRTRTGTMMIIAYVPGSHAEFCAICSQASSGAPGWATTTIDHWNPTAARPPPIAQVATSQDTGCRPRASSSAAVAPKTTASLVSTSPYHWPVCQLGSVNGTRTAAIAASDHETASTTIAVVGDGGSPTWSSKGSVGAIIGASEKGV